MLRYSINKVSYDYCQILIVYSFQEFTESIINALDSVDKADIALDVHDRFVMQAIKAIVELDIEDINEEFEFIENINPLINVIGDLQKEDLNKEIIVIYSSPILNYDYELILPKYCDIDKTDININDEDLNMIIDFIMVQNNFCENKEVDIVSKKSDIYIEMYSKEKLINHNISSPFSFNSSNPDYLIGKKINDKIEINNPLMNNSKSEFSICKIIDKIPLLLTDEIVKKINYKNIDNTNDFKEEIKNKYKKIIGFNKMISLIYDKIDSLNNIMISHFVYNHYKLSNNISKEKIYDIIKSEYIDAYLREQYYDDNDDEINTSGLDNYFQNEFDILHLFNVIDDLPFDEYLDARKNDANLYTLIKNRR